LRSREYDAIVDTQGLLKSAIVTRVAHGKRFGLGWKASREPLSAFYDETFDVPWTLHAVERNRTLAAHALAYRRAEHVDYGIAAKQSTLVRAGTSPYAVLIHATSARTKLWPEQHWVALGTALAKDGVCCVLPWGSDDEHARSTRLAASIPEATVPPRLPVRGIAGLLADAHCAVGVDTGLTHLAGALGLPTVGIYVSTDPCATGLYGCRSAANVGGRDAIPSVEEVIRVLRQLPR
jgi:heptosyltransferase-1